MFISPDTGVNNLSGKCLDLARTKSPFAKTSTWVCVRQGLRACEKIGSHAEIPVETPQALSKSLPLPRRRGVSNAAEISSVSGLRRRPDGGGSGEVPDGGWGRLYEGP